VGPPPTRQEVLPERRLDAAGELDVVLLELGDDPLLVHAGNARHREDADLLLGAQKLPEAVARHGRGRRQCAGLGHATDLLLGEGDALDLVGAQQVEELRHRQLDGPRSQQPALEERQQDDHDQGIGERELDALAEARLHRGPLCSMLASGSECVKRTGLFPLDTSRRWP